ncbi:hypothetical protein [Tsukamurella pseudospumae]|uniref:Uncharacterized protein n=1 Tax=Tsukamurella pseudospumae TaxID=239498 RepID=A0A137ZRW1_9ACTN|nr:hypothetical protein [Tsukamurella pseudospumae]KXP00905.1 hypothetical protein AXK61_12920 [Tsukamurella pseudospumae]
MPVDVRFHTKALQYERGQVVHGLTRSPVLDGLITRGLVEVLAETPDQPIELAAPEHPSDTEPPVQDEAAEPVPAPADAPRRGRKRAEDADQ